MEIWNSYLRRGTQVPTRLDIHKQAHQKLQRQPGYNNPGSFIPPQTPRRQGREALREGGRASTWNTRGVFPSEGVAVCACRTCRRRRRCQSRLAYPYSDGWSDSPSACRSRHIHVSMCVCIHVYIYCTESYLLWRFWRKGWTPH